MQAETISGVLLAAGPSSRLAGGLPKQLLAFGGEPLVRRIARQALASRLGEVIVVLGYEDERVRKVLADLGVRIVVNRAWAEGQSTSVRLGLGLVSPEAAGAVFLPCDQPFLNTGLIDRLIETYLQTGGPIVLPSYRGRRGAPVLFSRALFSELEGIVGDEGGRQVLEHHAGTIVEVELSEERPLLDVDTDEDYRELLGLARGG